VVLQERDDNLLLALYEYGLLRTDQIATLLFPSLRTAQLRLMLLYHNGYVQRRFESVEYGNGQGQAIYFLDTKGARHVARELKIDLDELDWKRQRSLASYNFLEHFLETHDVRIALTQAAQKLGWEIEQVLDESQLKSEEMKDIVVVKWVDEDGTPRRRRMAVIADLFFTLRVVKRIRCFVEVDRGNVSIKRWKLKIRSYIAYWETGKYQQRYQSQRVRILVVTPDERRHRRLKAATEEVGGRSRFWFTTAEKIAPETVLTAPIWEIAGMDGAHPLVDPEQV